MNKNMLGFLLFILAVIAGAALVWPKAQSVRALSAERKAREEVEKKKTERLKGLQTLNGEFASQKDRIDKVISTLPQEPQIPEVLVTIESIAKEAGVNVLTIAPQINEAKKEVTVSITGDGELNGIESLAKAISENNRPISIGSLSIVKGSDSKRLTFTMSLSFPYIPKTVTIPGGAQ